MLCHTLFTTCHWAGSFSPTELAAAAAAAAALGTD